MSKEMELSMQTSYSDGRWHVTLQAHLRTMAACDAMINILEIVRPLIAENDHADNAELPTAEDVRGILKP